MTKLTVLYADDHIPDSSIPKEKDRIKEFLQKRHPDWKDENTIVDWTNAYYYARQVISVLEDVDYAVSPANTYLGALELAKTKHFDIAIIDVGWYDDRTLPKDKRGSPDSAGWDICDGIEEAEKKRAQEARAQKTEPGIPTMQIAYSKRYVENPSLSTTAVQKGALPFFKTYQDTNAPALLAVVEFLKKRLSARSPLEDLAIRDATEYRELIVRSLTASQTQQQQWSVLTLVFVAISLMCVLAGAIFTIRGNIEVGTLAAIGSVVSGAISSLFFRQLQRSQKEANKSREEALEYYRDALGRLSNHAGKP